MAEIDFLKYWGAFETQLTKDMRQVSEQTKPQISPEAYSAGQELRSIMVFLSTRRSGHPGVTNKSIGNRLFLMQIYLQGSSVTEQLVLSGQYFKAAVCLRQEVDILTRLREERGGVAVNGRLPNVGNHAPQYRKGYKILRDRKSVV